MEYIIVIFTFAGMMEHKTNVYSILPSSVKSPFLEVLFTCLEIFTCNFLLVGSSLLTTFPGVLSYCLAKLIEGMSLAVTDGNLNSYSMEEILRDYNSLGFAVKELYKRLGPAVLIFNLTMGCQQTAQTYCIFQLLRAGLTSRDTQMLFFDLMVFPIQLVLHDLV
jgi:hypothetical protein